MRRAEENIQAQAVKQETPPKNSTSLASDQVLPKQKPLAPQATRLIADSHVAPPTRNDSLVIPSNVPTQQSFTSRTTTLAIDSHVAPPTNTNHASSANLSIMPIQKSFTSQADPVALAANGHDLTTDQGLKAWVHQQYAQAGFDSRGNFRGFPHLKIHLQNLTKTRPGLETSAIATMLM